MKKILLILSLLIYSISNAQIVNIPDTNFKQALLSASTSNQIAMDFNGNYTTIDTNNDNEIQESEALSISEINVNSKPISDFSGIEAFINLTSLDFSFNNSSIIQIDVSNNLNLIYIYCNFTHLTNFNISHNPNLISLNCENSQLTSLTIDNSSIKELWCGGNQLTSLDVSNSGGLEVINCENNQLTSLDVSNNGLLEQLQCDNNQLSNIDVSNNINLTYFECKSNLINTLDISNNVKLNQIECENNNNLEYINLKNGTNDNLSFSGWNASNFENLPNLQTVCVDELNTDLTTYIETQTDHSITFTEYCNLNPAQSNIINGIVNIDLENNGCDINDGSIDNVLLTANNGSENFATFTQDNGDYLLYTSDGDFTTTVTTNLPDYWSTSPYSYSNTFTDFNNTFTADFCIAPNQIVNDINISLIPINDARPGFDAAYQLVYKNVGTTILNGNITLAFDETKLSFLNASETRSSQTSNSLTFDYSNFNPFETRTIDLEFNVSVPPTVEIDDILNFTTTINPIASDYTTDDNIFVLNQIVVGSYDPNDITCLEGKQVLYADKDKYLHYIIRFQNTGTASAINVVVKNILDNHLDWSTLQLESLSHNNRVAIKNGNEIEFVFENIDLPDSTTDEPNSHGFIAYKIKPKADITLDDIILNKVDIFFDYNSPIETNIASTRIVNVLAVNENTLLDFSIYPIPTENILTIKSKTEISKTEIYNNLGQLILLNETENKIDISSLTNGLYFVKVEDINGNFGMKMMMKK